MLAIILLLLIVLWAFGYFQLPVFAVPLFSFRGGTISWNDLLVFLVIIWLIGLLPYPFQEIAGVFFLLWILSSLGVITIAGFSNLMLLAIIVGLIAFIARGTTTY